MVVLQIKNVRDSLRFRWSEWACSGVMILWGFILLQPGDSLATSAAWQRLATYAPEWAWGAFAFAFGVVRISVLSWNGRWSRCSQARMYLAFGGAMFWGFLVWTIIMFAGVWATGLAAYAGYMFLDLGVIYIASYDNARLEEARRNGAV